MGFPGGAVVKNLPANAGEEREMDSISGSGRAPGGGSLLQYSCLENSMDRGTGWGHKESDLTEQLSTEHRDSMQYFLATWTILRNTVMKQKAQLQWVEWRESRLVVSDTLQSHGLYGPGNSLGQNTGVGSFLFSRGSNPTQGSNPGLLHCRWILYQLSHKGSP